MFRASPPQLSLSCSPPLFCLSLLIDLSASTVFTMPQSEYTVKIYNPLHHSSTHQAPVVPISPKEAKLLLQLTGPMLLLLSHFSQVRLFATPWTAAHQAPLSMGFSRQEHWSGLPFPSPMHESEVAQSCPTLRDFMDCSLPGSSVHGIFQARV